MEDTIPSSDSARSDLLSDPALRQALVHALRKRVPEADVEDLAQATLADALLAQTAPSDAVELRRWVHGILRNKVADFYRQRRREAPLDPDGGGIAADSAPVGARDLLRWAEKELPEGGDASGTLDFMLREGDGEKLETIAREERVPAPRLRQRIARLRRHFRTRWAAQMAAVGALSLFALGLFVLAKRFATQPEVVPIASEPALPLERARELRRAALEDCRHEKYRECLDGLERARALDANGDAVDTVRAARSAAVRALAPAPAPTLSTSAAPLPLPVPTSSATPRPSPIPTTSLAPKPVPTAPSRAPYPRKARATSFPSDMGSGSQK